MSEQAQLNCPNCKFRIGLDDINVQTDIALCRNCGGTFSFSLIHEASELLSGESLDLPTRGVRIYEDFGGRKTIVYKALSPVLLFLIPFTAFWSGLSMWGLYIQPLMKGQINWSKFLFGVPFLLGTIVLLSVIFFLLFGKWVITLGNGQGSVFVGAGALGWKRYFTYGPGSLVSLRNTSLKVNNKTQQGIAIIDGQNEFVFGATIRPDAKMHIARLLARETANT